MKKHISFILVLVLIVLPFSILLKTSAATQIVTTTGNLVDNDVTVTINNVRENDSFQAYKIVDIFYNQNTNEMTYGFTSAFQTFITNSQNQTVHSLTIDKYMNLSYDNNIITINGVTQPDVRDIMMEYAAYLNSNNTSGIALTKTDSSTISHALKAGAYLILPSAVNSYSNSHYGGISMFYNTYRTILFNGTFTISNNGDWLLQNRNISLKYNFNGIEAGVFTAPTATVRDAVRQAGDFTALLSYFNYPTTYTIGKDYSIAYYITNYHETISNYPNTTIANNAVIANRIKYTDLIFPQGIDYDIDKLYAADDGGTFGNDIYDVKVVNGNIYLETDTNNENSLGHINVSSRKISIESTISHLAYYIDTHLNSNCNLGSTGNVVTIVAYEVKDLYATITSTITDEDIDNAFIYEGTANDTTKYQEIRNALNRVEVSFPVYTAGIEITNVDIDTNNGLVGAEFGVFEYDATNSTCTNTQIGSNFTVGNNNKANFIGVDINNKFCIKQLKTPTGYILNNTDIVIGPNTDYSTVDQNGNYALTVTNTKMLSLPFTGGSGTVVYVVVGLLVVVCAAAFVIIYKKKNNKDEKK